MLHLDFSQVGGTIDKQEEIYIVFVTMLAVATAYSPEEWKEIFGRMED
nr:hypothetical protein [uncultured Prevotella sp.]